jgi:hypothetical protein
MPNRASSLDVSPSRICALIPRMLGIVFACAWSWQQALEVKAQTVNLTLTLDTNQVAVGQSTTLRAFAQVVPEQRAGADRIFSWYVDLLNSSTAVAQPDFSQIQKPSSDNDSQLSSTGATSGLNRLGIYDTFLNRAGAGVSAPVLLFSVPVTGVAAGKNTFSLRAGTGVAGLANDFLVAPLGGGDPLTGGNYLAAIAQLQVTSSSNELRPFSLTLTRLAPVELGRWEITFPTVSGWNYYLQTRSSMSVTSSWNAVLSSSLTSGKITITNKTASSFYRVQAQPAP